MSGNQAQPVLDAPGLPVGEGGAHRPDQVGAVVRAARAAQPEWEALGADGRSRRLRELRDWILANATRLAGLLQAETGKPRTEAELEILVSADLINYFTGRRLRRALAEQRPRPGALLVAKRISLAYRPFPAVAVFVPANAPVGVLLMDAIPALMAGAAVIVKPNENTPIAVREILRGWRADLAAPDVFRGVYGGEQVGAALVDEADFVQFTGSTAVGRAIGRRAAERLVPCSLELGGKDAMIVLADADLERAANAALWGATFNAGQTCLSVERVYVEEPIHDRFLELLARKAGDLVLGSDTSHTGGRLPEMGPLQTDQLRRRVAEQVADAVGKGARVVAGGRAVAGAGCYFEPTILADVDHSMRCMREETFGPVIPVMKVADADQAVALANDSAYGLSATVWTRDLVRAKRIARSLEVGAVNINDMFINAFCPAAPQGGWKDSGIGARFGGPAAITKYCLPQVITTPRLAARSELLWYPYTRSKTRLAAAFLRRYAARGRYRAH